MNIFLLGKGGQVGWELQRSLASLGQLTALGFDSTSHCSDFTNLQGEPVALTQKRKCLSVIDNQFGSSAYVYRLTDVTAHAVCQVV